MERTFEVRTASELIDEEFTAKWREREALDPLPRAVLRAILDRFVEQEGPVPLEALASRLGDLDPADLGAAITVLDEKDLILARDGRVLLAYPFAAGPTDFRLILPDGSPRYAVCAIDALGIPAFLGRRVTIESRCYHCGGPLVLDVGPDGPVGSDEVMVWVGRRGASGQKACVSFCLTLNFFQSLEDLAAWRATRPAVPGAAAVLGEAFVLGAAIFGERLRALVRRAEAETK